MARVRVGYLGPAGSFSNEAVTTLDNVVPVPLATLSDILAGVADGSLDQGLVPLENAIEGTVSATIDGLVFDHDLFIEREVVIPIRLHLLARSDTSIATLTTVWSYVHALAQCRTFLSSLPGVTSEETTSTSQAARMVAESKEPWAAVGSALAGELFGLVPLASDIEDHQGNVTRFVVIGRETIAPASGHDRTTIVCFQDADQPGSLYGILGRIAARDINLTKLESRPTKRGLGDYCFVIEFEGHVADDVVADCLADLSAHHTRVKFLGSYPVTGDEAAGHRREFLEARQTAETWLATIRARIRP